MTGDHAVLFRAVVENVIKPQTSTKSSYIYIECVEKSLYGFSLPETICKTTWVYFRLLEKTSFPSFPGGW